MLVVLSLQMTACTSFTEAVRHSTCMEYVHTDDRLIEVVIKNWLRGSKDLGGGRRVRYYKLMQNTSSRTEPPLPQLDMSDVAGDLDDTVVFDNDDDDDDDDDHNDDDDDDDDDGTVARRNVSFRISATPNSPILQQ